MTIQDIIDVIRSKKRIKIKFVKNPIYERNRKVKKLQKKLSKGKKIKVGFFITSDSTFPSKSVFQEMLKVRQFEPKIVVIPITNKGEEYEKTNLKNVYENMKQEFGEKNVISSFDGEEYINFDGKFDIICFSNPYNNLTNLEYKIQKLAKESLCFFVPYFMSATSYIHDFAKVRTLRHMWKIYVDSKGAKKIYQKDGNLNPKQLVISGFPRVDELARVKQEKRNNKKIIIAPHSYSKVRSHGIEFSEFINFYDVLVDLPGKYPQIDFVFRPHPFLFSYLLEDGEWTKEQIDSYIKKWKSYKNVKYQDGGDFSYDFINSDGIIHDCGSFLPEYLITEHPACYMQTSKETYRNYFAKVGQDCLDNCYIADSKQKVYDFVENVILKENDFKKRRRINFVRENLKANYGNISKFIMTDILKSLEA